MLAMKASTRSIRVLAVLLALLVAGASGPVSAQAPAALPTPEKFFGFQMGADRKLANWDKLHEYYQLLAKSSNRVKLVELGKSSEGRPFIALFISSPANLARARTAAPDQREARRSARHSRSRGQEARSPTARPSRSRASRCTRPRWPHRRRPRSSSTTA